MVGKFLSKFGSAIKNKDIVLIGSATHLLREGVVGYVDSLLESIAKIVAGPRGECTVLPAPFVLVGGCRDPGLLRNILDFHAWIRISGMDPDGVLNDAMGVIEHRISSGSDPVVHWSPVHYRLPLNLPSKIRTTTYSEGPANLPGGAAPFGEQTEKLIITSLLSNITDFLGKNGIIIDCDPFNSVASSTRERRKIVVVGGPHAERTHAALQQRGADAQLLLIPNYRTSSLHAGKIREGLSKLCVEEDTWLVMQVFDSGLFMAAPPDGGLVPPCMRADGKVHVDGDLVLLPKDLQYDLFKQLDSELTSHKHLKILFMAPLPRYYNEACCSDPDHVGNIKQPDYRRKMEDGIYAARTNIKGFAFRHGYRNSSAVSSWGKLKKLEDLWANQVELKAAGYDAIADAILEAGEELCKKRKVGSDSTPPPNKKPKLAARGSGGGNGGANSADDGSVRGRGGGRARGNRGTRARRADSSGGGRGGGRGGHGGGGHWNESSRGPGWSNYPPPHRDSGWAQGGGQQWIPSGQGPPPNWWQTGRGGQRGHRRPRGQYGPKRGGGHY
jgi:hypothetical protein